MIEAAFVSELAVDAGHFNGTAGRRKSTDASHCDSLARWSNSGTVA